MPLIMHDSRHIQTSQLPFLGSLIPKVGTRALRTSFERHLTNLMHEGGRKYDTDVGISFENVADVTIDFGSMPGF